MPAAAGDRAVDCFAASGCGRWSPAGVLTLTDTKLPLGNATVAVASARWSRCGCHRPLQTRFAVPATASARLELVLPNRSSLRLTHEWSLVQ